MAISNFEATYRDLSELLLEGIRSGLEADLRSRLRVAQNQVVQDFNANADETIRDITKALVTKINSYKGVGSFGDAVIHIEVTGERR